MEGSALLDLIGQDGKRVVVTQAATGIGLGMTMACTERGESSGA